MKKFIAVICLMLVMSSLCSCHHASNTSVGDIVYDSNNIEVSVTNYKPHGFWGATIHLLVVNTSDKNVCVVAEQVSVNDYMMDAFWSAEVAAGKQLSTDMIFSEAELTRNGITKIDEVEFVLSVIDPITHSTISEPNTVILTFN